MRIISALAVSGAITAAAISSASAADLYVKAPPVAVVEAYNWSGWYAGVGFGYMTGDSNWTNVLGGASTSVSNDKGVGSVYAGAQYQFGSFLGWGGGIVVGAEVSQNFALGSIDGGSACPTGTSTCQAQLTRFYTAGGRLGFAWDRFMVYGSGGVAGGDIDTQIITAAGVAGDGTSENHRGTYYGGGVDYMVWRDKRFSVIFGVDYKHIDLDSKTHFSQGAVVNATSRTVDLTNDVVQGRLTVKMDGPAWFW